jgi:hypothetical protein
MARKKNLKEDIELAKEHIDLAEQIVVEQAKNANPKSAKVLENAAFSLEKAEADLEEVDK